MRSEKVIFLILTIIMIICPSLLIILVNGSIPPNESKILYSGVLFGVSLIIFSWIWYNQSPLQTLLQKKINNIQIILFIVFSLSILTYLLIKSHTVVTVQGKSPVFFPIWLQGELYESTKIVGSKEKFVESYGPDMVIKLINNSSKFSMVITRIIFISIYIFMFSPFVIAFSILYIRVGTNEKNTEQDRTIFFSYAWGGKSEEIIDELYDSLKRDEKYTLLRDKMDLGYKGLISEFMKRIGRGNFVVVAISDKYLKSEYCMFELYELYRNSRLDRDELLAKIYPIRVEDLNLNDPSILDVYFEHWEKLENEWKQLVNNRGVDQTKHRMVESIKNSLRDLLPFLSDVNSKTKEILSKDNFEEIKSSIEERIKLTH